MKSCKTIQNSLPLFITEDLSEKSMSEIKNHLTDCSDCQLVLKEMQYLHSGFISNKITPPENYKAELVVNINKKLEKSIKQKKQSLFAIPALSIAIAMLLYFFIIPIDKKISPNSDFISQEEMEIILELGHVGYFSDYDIYEVQSKNTNLVNFSSELDNFFSEASSYILQNPQTSFVEDYSFCTAEMNDEEFSKMIQNIKTNKL